MVKDKKIKGKAMSEARIQYLEYSGQKNSNPAKRDYGVHYTAVRRDIQQIKEKPRGLWVILQDLTLIFCFIKKARFS